MRVFLAGASGAIGRGLAALLVRAGHQVTGTTRNADKAGALRALGADPVVVDVFDTAKLSELVAAARPDAIVHQLTDLPFAPGTPRYEEGIKRNARLRIEGTRNLIAAARAACVARMVAQSIAFVYAPGAGARVETDPLAAGAPGLLGRTVEAVQALENGVLALPEGIVLRYAFLYGPGTWFVDGPGRTPAVHVDAAAQAALLALSKGKPGVYNVGEDDPGLSSEKAKLELNFDASFRLDPAP
jgi:nucleoside-diphosphate-sugar epimerase